MAEQSKLKPFATATDALTFFGSLKSKDFEVAENVIPIVSDMLRLEARKVGKDLDAMIQDNPEMKDIAKVVVLDVVYRYINTLSGNYGEKIANESKFPVTQTTHSAGGYSLTNTYQVPAPGLFIKKSELARLGLRRQQVGVINFGGSV